MMRRHFLRLTVVVAVVVATGGMLHGADALRPVSMAMHIHGSFSEGIASYEAHLQQARANKVDVIWWTDHDFRIAAHHYRKAVHFDGVSEKEGGLEWTWKEEREGDLASGSSAFVADPHSPDEPNSAESAGLAMRLAARGGAGPGLLAYRGTAWNWTYSRSLADTTLELDVFAEETGPGREVVLQIESSYHPARNGRPAGQYMLEYRIAAGIAAAAASSHRHEGLRGIVSIAAPAGKWHRVHARPVDDIQKIWPDLVAEDNSLHQLRVGVRVTANADTRAVVDRLRFDRGKGEGESGIALRRAVLARYAGEYPDVVHHEAFEVSLVRHLNWFGGTLTMPPLVSPPYRNNDADLTEQMIAFMHRHGALAQWNHPLDAESPESLLKLMIARKHLDADIMEIGRAPLDKLRQVFDTAARNALFITGVGVSDDHAGRDWMKQKDTRLTYVWAASTSSTDLTTALRAGRAWWVDPAAWRGTLGLAVNGEQAMGAALVTTDSRVPVEITATKIPDGGALVILDNPVDYPGPQPSTPASDPLRLTADRLRADRYEHIVDAPTSRYLRLQVLDKSGAVVGESNPLWILREPPAGGIPEARRIKRTSK